MTGSARLAGRVALVTGASKGIGRATAMRLGADGADVCVNYRKDPGPAEEVVSLIRDGGRKAVAVQADVSDPDQVTALIDRATRELGTVDILVNNAAIFPWKLWSDVSVAEWDETFAVNSRGPWLMAKAVMPRMIDAGWGRVINLASATFLTGSPFLAHYSASKGAVIGLTRSLARSVGVHGVTVNAVTTGKTLTEGFNKYFEEGVLDYEETISSRSTQAIPRIGQPNDVAGAISFLASADADYITGQLINVDGGRNMY